MNWKYIIISLASLVCFSSCEEEFAVDHKGKNDGSLNLVASAPDSFIQTRADGEADHFIKDTKFYLYATKSSADGNSEDWNTNYLLKSPNSSSGEQDALAIGIATDVINQANKSVRINSFESTTVDNPERYILADKFNDKPLNLYGIVAASNSETEREALEQEYSRSRYSFIRENDKPAALKVSYYRPSAPTAESEEQTLLPLPDFMWSGSLKNLTPFNNSGDIVMPFKHIFSKLRFYAIYLDDETTTTGPNGETLPTPVPKPEIKITGLRVKDYREGIVSFSTGLFDYKNGAADYSNVQRSEWIPVYFASTDGVKPLDQEPTTSTAPFATTKIFPTYNTDYNNKFEGTPVGELSTITEEKVGANHAVKIQLDIEYGGNAANGTAGTSKTLEATLQLAQKNFAFAPNHEYDIILTLTTESVVVAVIPRYYEYISEPEILGDYEMGEPIDFGGMLWASENLGATSADPTANAEAWENARGFYYQYGRNIPYYARGSVLDPYPDIATYSEGNVPTADRWDYENENFLYGNSGIHIPQGATDDGYDIEQGHGARAYPYIPALWENEIKNAGGNKETGYKNFLKFYRFYSPNADNGQTNVPTKNFSDPYIANYIIDKPDSYQKTSVAYSAYFSDADVAQYLKARYWNQIERKPKNWHQSEDGNNESDPCPKGWRLPEISEFLSIFPYDHCCGDITFNPGWDGSNNANGFGRFDSHYNTFDHSKTGVFAEPIPASSTNGDYKGLASVYVGIYNDGEGYTNLVEEKVDPNSYKDVTINENLTITTRDVTQFREGWGTIYGIKCAGTSQAYALRWQIKIVGYDPIKKEVEAGLNPPHQESGEQDFLGRGVLVISKYELGSDKDKVYLHYRIPKDGEIEKTKGAAYKCIAFTNEDTDPDLNLDWNEYNATYSKEVKLDWEHPDGIIYFPITGYIIIPSTGKGQALIYPGREVLYWASTPGESNNKGNFGSAVRMKFSGDYKSRYIYRVTDEYIANGANIRCVRDTRAEIR